MHWPGAFRWMAGSLVFSAVALAAAGCGSSGTKSGTTAGAGAQTIRFQKPTDPGPQPFTPAADITGPKTVSLQASGPYGGSGSDHVCNRDLLIRFLKENPDRMREWARVLGIDPSYKSVSRYIAKLHPVTLTKDTQVTNHSFVNGHATGFQSILQAGTAVLVDKYGRPVARCRCGNPLTEPTYFKSATCTGCPPHYTPPTYCKFWSGYTDYDHDTYTSDYYSNDEYDKVFIVKSRKGPYINCYEAYPEPPPVTVFALYKQPPPQTAPYTAPPSTTYSAPPQQYQRHPYPGTTGGTTGTTGGGTTGGGTTGGGTTGGGTTGGGTTGGGTTGGGGGP